VRKDVDDLLKNPEIRRLLGPELIEVAVARSHNLTRDAFIEDGAWWLLRGQVDERESTLEEKKSRQAAWRRLTDLIERNPILHQRPAVQYGDLNDLLKFGHEGSARLNALRNNETGRHNITRKNPRYATILQTSLLTKGFSLS